MLLIDNEGQTDPTINLAIEEVLLRSVVADESLFLLYENEPAVIVGRNQNIFGEVNLRYAEAQGIHIVRRLSGGGTVYHDRGNLNFSVICPEQTHLHDFAHFTSIVSGTLHQFGIETTLRNRSSLFVGEGKISGNAQYATRGKLLHHGTLLYDTDTVVLQKVITPPAAEVTSHAVASVRSEVLNLRGLLGPAVELAALRRAIVEEVRGRGPLAPRQLSRAEWVEAEALAQERYRDWAWTYGRSPRSTITRDVAAGLRCSVTVDKGCIMQMAWQGAGSRAAGEALDGLAAALVGMRYEAAAMREVARSFALDEAIIAALLP